jgi:ATP-dependent Zn protease
MNVAIHEAAHAVVAVFLGGRIVRAIATADENVVRTRFRVGRTPQQEAQILWRQAVVDLAGPAAELRRLRAGAWAVDEANAAKRVRDIVTLKAGLDEDASLTPVLRAEVDRLLEEAHVRASELVARYSNEIERVAAVLARGEPLTGEDIYALMLSGPPAQTDGREVAAPA